MEMSWDVGGIQMMVGPESIFLMTEASISLSTEPANFLVSPEAKRRPAAGADGMSFLCIGGVSGGIYEPWAPPDE